LCCAFICHTALIFISSGTFDAGLQSIPLGSSCIAVLPTLCCKASRRSCAVLLSGMVRVDGCMILPLGGCFLEDSLFWTCLVKLHVLICWFLTLAEMPTVKNTRDPEFKYAEQLVFQNDKS